MTAFQHEARDYEGLLDGLRARIEQLNVAGETLDQISGLARGHAHKLVGVRPVKTLGLKSLGDMLGALGLRIVLEHDQDAFDLVAGRLKRRADYQIRRALRIMVTAQYLRGIGKVGAEAGHAKRTPEQRKSHATRLVNIRWRKYRRDRKLEQSK